MAKSTADGWVDMPGQPKVCAGCGERIYLSGPKAESHWFGTNEETGECESWHFRCRPAWTVTRGSEAIYVDSVAKRPILKLRAIEQYDDAEPWNAPSDKP